MSDIEIDDVEDALLRADELAELTGRKKTDIVADLLDDGQLNMSAGTDSEKPKDFLDIAQEKAEKLKTLLATLIPILALLMGIGAEGMGILNLTEWGADSIWEEGEEGEPQIRWGCMDANAINYDETAHQDDGSCDYEPPDCNPEWRWEDVMIQSADLDSEGFKNDLEINTVFTDLSECGVLMDGHFSIRIEHEENDGPPWQEYQIDDNFHNEYVMDEDHRNLPGGQYVIRVDYHPAHDMGFVEGPSTLVIIEEEPRCDITLWDILLETNNSSAHLQYDLDCGDDESAEGFNVSVQFWNTIANSTDTENYSIGFHYIQGEVSDIQELFLHNITCNTYDFKWIAVWEDEDGNTHDLYETWSDIYMAGEN